MPSQSADSANRIVRYHFEDMLSADDVKRHIRHAFQTPDGCEQVAIHFHFAPPQVDGILNMLCLTLFDSEGFRGAGHRHGDTHEVRIEALEATPGYRAGPLPAGEWTVEIDTHMVMPGEACSYDLDIALTVVRETDPTGGEFRAIVHDATPASGGPGWRRGDLHAHTNHSDAAWTASDLLAAARELDLDFVTLTDHNTISGLTAFEAAGSANLLTMGGLELTTFWGHALCLGTREWIDWRVDAEGRQMAEIAQRCYDNDHLFIIAHPAAPGDPECTGCQWRYPQMRPGTGQLVEVWNGPWSGDSNNEQALATWYEWLNQGRRLVATAGSDAHGRRDYGPETGFSIIFAEALTEDALLRALTEGHLYLSSGPCLSVTGRNEQGDEVMMGDVLSGVQAILSIEWRDCPLDAVLRLIADGIPILEEHIQEGGHMEQSMAIDQTDWIAVEIREREGGLLALANPIYLKTDAITSF